MHLRRVGVEARPDLVHGIPKGDIGGSPSKENDDNDSDKSPKDDTDKDDRGGSENPSPESEINPTPESSETHNLDNQPVESSECCNLDHEIALYVFPSEFTKEMPVVPRETSVHFVWEYIVLFHVLPYISSLYIIILNYSFEFRQVV